MMPTVRNQEIDSFLPKGAARTPLAGDASFRRYERILNKGHRFVLMDAPPDKENITPFVALAKHLKAEGFSAPEVKKIDFEKGLLLLEDLGDDTFNRILAGAPNQETPLYEAAIDVLAALHSKPVKKTLGVSKGKTYTLGLYTEEKLFEELFLFFEWYLKAILPAPDPNQKKLLIKIWQPLFQKVITNQPVLTLRDYHADNLMWLAHRQGLAKVGLLDFQDALLGHPAYDIVSLLQDARRPYQRDLEKAMISRYLNQAPIQNKEDFLAAYEILGAQRNAKIIGIFTRLWCRDGKAQYPQMIPHVWSLLEKNLTHPILAEAKAWFDEVAPKPLRLKIPG